MKEPDEFEAKIKKTLELITETIECASSKLISDVNIEKWIGIKIKKIEVGNYW